MIKAHLLKCIGNILSPAGANARLSILIYHRVLNKTDPIFPQDTTAERFDAEMTELKSVFNVIPLSDAIAKLKSGRLPPRAASITFDDGYADNLHVALPILLKHDLVATFFIASSYLNGGRMFNDTVIESIRRSTDTTVDLSPLGFGRFDIGSNQAKAKAIGALLARVKYLPPAERADTVDRLAHITGCGPLPSDLMMTTDELKRLHAAGMEIGGHTATHPILAKLDNVSAKNDIAAGKEWLEHVLGDKIRLFAYPNGKPGIDYLPEQARLVRDLGFDGAVTTQAGAARQTSDPFQLPRFTPWRPQIQAFIPQILGNLRS